MNDFESEGPSLLEVAVALALVAWWRWSCIHGRVDMDNEPEQPHQFNIRSLILLLFILTWITVAFHSCMIKLRLDRIEQQIQCR